MRRILDKELLAQFRNRHFFKEFCALQIKLFILRSPLSRKHFTSIETGQILPAAKFAAFFKTAIEYARK